MLISEKSVIVCFLKRSASFTYTQIHSKKRKFVYANRNELCLVLFSLTWLDTKIKSMNLSKLIHFEIEISALYTFIHTYIYTHIQIHTTNIKKFH